MTRRDRAAALNDQARRLESRARTDEAVELYQQAAAADPKWSVPLYNLGLLFKNRRDWRKSLHYNRLATELDPGNEAAWWNLGIAATALGRWGIARTAWRGFGVDVPAGTGPIDLPCGTCPIRLNPDGDAEVVWARRLDPARAELASIPLPESGFRWNDLILNDGAPNGFRTLNGQEVPVFDMLALLQPGPFGTFVAEVRLKRGKPAAVDLAKEADRLGGSAEDWSVSIRMFCKACSEGRPHATHDTKSAPPRGAHMFGLAARDLRHARRIAAAWEAAGAEVKRLDEALKPG